MIDRIFLFGTISGLIVIGSMIGVFVASSGQPEMGQHSEFLGYTIMLVALSMIFFGIKSYRDRELGGVIRFLPAFMMGIGISVVAGIIYVLVWEVYMAFTHYTFMDAFVNSYIAKQKAAGITGAALEKVVAEMNAMKVQYANPLFRLPMTFMEIFPVGFLISLLSAAVLRRSDVLPAQG
jgi:hypothetical protein